MSIDNQSLPLTIGQDLTFAFDMASGQSAPAAAEFTVADKALGTVPDGFPLTIADGGIVVSTGGGVGGVDRLTVTIPHAASELIAHSGSVWTLWDTSSGVYVPLASGNVTARLPAAVPA